MRAILLLLILLVVGVIAAVATGFLSIDQTQSAKAPDISASREGVAAQGGQAPKFNIDTGSIALGKGEATVPVPRIDVRPAAENGQAPAEPQATTNSTQP